MMEASGCQPPPHQADAHSQPLGERKPELGAVSLSSHNCKATPSHSRPRPPPPSDATRSASPSMMMMAAKVASFEREIEQCRNLFRQHVSSSNPKRMLSSDKATTTRMLAASLTSALRVAEAYNKLGLFHHFSTGNQTEALHCHKAALVALLWASSLSLGRRQRPSQQQQQQQQQQDPVRGQDGSFFSQQRQQLYQSAGVGEAATNASPSVSTTLTATTTKVRLNQNGRRRRRSCSPESSDSRIMLHKSAADNDRNSERTPPPPASRPHKRRFSQEEQQHRNLALVSHSSLSVFSTDSADLNQKRKRSVSLQETTIQQQQQQQQQEYAVASTLLTPAANGCGSRGVKRRSSDTSQRSVSFHHERVSPPSYHCHDSNHSMAATSRSSLDVRASYSSSSSLLSLSTLRPDRTGAGEQQQQHSSSFGGSSVLVLENEPSCIASTTAKGEEKQQHSDKEYNTAQIMAALVPTKRSPLETVSLQLQQEEEKNPMKASSSPSSCLCWDVGEKDANVNSGSCHSNNSAMLLSKGKKQARFRQMESKTSALTPCTPDEPAVVPETASAHEKHLRPSDSTSSVVSLPTSTDGTDGFVVVVARGCNANVSGDDEDDDELGYNERVSSLSSSLSTIGTTTEPQTELPGKSLVQEQHQPLLFEKTKVVSGQTTTNNFHCIDVTIAITLTDLGNVYRSLQLWQPSVSAYRKALRRFQRLRLSLDHPEVAATWRYWCRAVQNRNHPPNS